MEEASNCSPAMAVPMTVKMPEPMTAPMPSAVRDHGPSVFFRLCSGASESLMSLSMDFRAKTWCDRVGSCGHFSEGSVPAPGLSREKNSAGQAQYGLSLALAARQFPYLLLVRATRCGAFCLGGCLLARRTLQLFTFLFVLNLLCICHSSP